MSATTAQVLSPLDTALLAGLSALLAAACAAAVARFAAPLGLVHAPNNRSLHHAATPHGGGIGVVVGFLAALTAAHALGAVSQPLWLCLTLAGGAIAAIGLWDDLHPLPAAPRLAVQLLVVGAALATAGAGLATPAPAFPWWLAAGLATLWWINLFNFMDGSDGLAATEACCIAVGAAGLIQLQQAAWPAGGADRLAAGELAACCWWLAAAAVGFLLLNRPPARIFLGDVGSTFLGFALAAIALVSVTRGQLPAAAWLLLGGVFWVDSTTTLLRRLLAGENWRQAHRGHAYQRLARRWQAQREQAGWPPDRARAAAHRRLVIALLATNGAWLLPLSALVIIAPPWSHPPLVAFGLAPLLGVVSLAGSYD